MTGRLAGSTGTAITAFSDSMVYCYNSFLGLPVAREAVAYFLAKRFLFPEKSGMAPEEALQHVDSQHVVLGSGCGSLLSHLFFCLGEEGDGVLIPAPYYAAFENDIKLVAGCRPLPVKMAKPALGPTPEDLEAVFLKAQREGISVKFLLLTNPNNPLGVIYRPDVVMETIKWARRKGLSIVADEIYALSTHKALGHGFQSIMKLLNNNLGDDVHMIWGLSKDFGASGFRVGVLYTQNSVLLESLANLNVFSGVSHPMQMITAELLTDDVFVDIFLEESRERLLKSYNICVRKLDEMVVPYIPAEAGLFVYVDFSSFLPSKTLEDEEKLANLMVDYVRVVLTPGESQRDPKPGMFRICYAWVNPDVLEIAMERLSRFVAKMRKMHWDDLNADTLTNIIH
mmetsp:Transcript_25582/g.39327  ORF Transcript_25582/g.39327 Transcript_25582/m.39327 type:complete len:398 (+) Transcript_25582:323-1516(+)